MRIIHTFSGSNKGEHNEDRIATRKNRAGEITGLAVIDGATSDSAVTHQGYSGGWWAAKLAADVFEKMPIEMTLPMFCNWVQDAYKKLQLDCIALPLYASFAALIKRPDGFYELWRVGDVLAGWHDTRQPDSIWRMDPMPKTIDKMNAETRSQVMWNMLKHGIDDPAILAKTGRASIAPALTQQLAFANRLDHKLGYGVLCRERPILGKFLQRKRLPHTATSVMLASDGFFDLRLSLHAMNIYREKTRRADPHLIGQHRQVKGFYDTNGTLRDYHDDTTAVHIALT